MSPDGNRTDQSAAWATLVVVLLVLIAVLLVGYFAWWAPARREPTVIQMPEREREVEVVPEREAPPPETPQPEEQPVEEGAVRY